MNFTKKITLFLATTLSASTVICGLSIASKPVVQASSLQFHMGFGLSALFFCFLAVALFARKTAKAKEA
jgi:hypothetical protein